jgi:hypothetical protein
MSEVEQIEKEGKEAKVNNSTRKRKLDERKEEEAKEEEAKEEEELPLQSKLFDFKQNNF